MAMIEAAEAEGRIEPGRTTIVEATSGNTGIALAFVCAARGYDLVLTLPQGMSRERESLLRAVRRAGEDHRVARRMGEAVAAARAMAAEPDVFLPDQFSNPANPEVHRRTTGPEIERALDGRVDVLVAGVGTGGTITGAGGYLRERNPDLRIVAVEPLGSAVLSGGPPGPHRIQGIGAGFVPAVLDRELIDEVIAVSDEDAIQTAWSARGARGCSRASPAAPRCGPRCRSPRARSSRASASSWSCPTPASATSRRRSSPPDASGPRPADGGPERRPRARPHGARPVEPRYAHVRGSVGIARQVLAASDRTSPRASATRRPRLTTFEILATWPGIHALLSHRVAHALQERAVPLLPRTLSL